MGTQGFISLSRLSPESGLTAPQRLLMCIPRGHLQPVLCSRPRPITHTPPAYRSPLWELDLYTSLLLALPCASHGDGGLPTGPVTRPQERWAEGGPGSPPRR